jgi:hypothetical protein
MKLPVVGAALGTAVLVFGHGQVYQIKVDGTL